LEKPDIRANSKMTFTQPDEVGEEEVCVWAYVVGLQPISVEDLQEAF
jgi:hypothetical protein